MKHWVQSGWYFSFFIYISYHCAIHNEIEIEQQSSGAPKVKQTHTSHKRKKNQMKKKIKIMFKVFYIENCQHAALFILCQAQG